MSKIRSVDLGTVLDLFAQAAMLVHKGCILHANAATLASLGGTADQFEGLPLRALLESESSFDLAEMCGHGEVDVPWRGGSTPGEVHRVDEETFIVVTHRDARDSLSVRMADFADAAAEGILIADAVGGINDPLASLSMSLEEAADRVTMVSRVDREDLEPLVEEARQAAHRVAEVVRSVLALPRAPARNVPLDLNELLERTVRTVARQRPAVEIDAHFGMCAPITAARERLEQVLVHVLLTAPAPEAGRAIRVGTRQSGENVMLELSGGGVAADQLRAFQRRYAVVTSLVQQIGGSCETEADEQAVRVRIAFGGSATKGTELAANRGRRDSAPPRGELRILVVDDEPSIHRALQRALRDVGMVQAVGSGNAAIELLQGGARFDVVLCDVVMANGTGLDLANWLERRDDPLKRRMILMTGMGESDSVSHPDIMTVAKPFDSAALRELVCQIAGRA